MPVHDSLIDLVGDTPLVRLRRLTEGLSATVLVKVEYLNPGGSVKDRAATAMVLAAERDGALLPGGTIVEASSGNTGIGLAQAAAVRGHRILVVLPNTVAVEKLDILRAYGAEVVTTPGTLPREHPEHVNNSRGGSRPRPPAAGSPTSTTTRPTRRSTTRSTGPEIWAATDGRVTHLVAGIGTGGTISGTGRFLKEKGGVEVVGADPLTSRYGGGDGSPYFVEAAGQYLHTETVDDAWPLSYHQDVVDRIETVDDRTVAADHPRVGAAGGPARRRVVRARRGGGAAGGARARARAHRGGDPGRLRAHLPVQVPLDGLAAPHGIRRRRPARSAGRRRRRGADRHPRPHRWPRRSRSAVASRSSPWCSRAAIRARPPPSRRSSARWTRRWWPIRPRRRASWPGRPRSRWARGRPRRRPSPGSTPRAQAARCCCATAASQAC
jgi:cystathionine beta-synthase